MIDKNLSSRPRTLFNQMDKLVEASSRLLSEKVSTGPLTASLSDACNKLPNMFGYMSIADAAIFSTSCGDDPGRVAR